MTIRVKNTSDQLDVTDAKLTGSSIRGSHLGASNFKDVSLQRASFDDVSLEDARITNSNLKSLAIGNCNTVGMTINGIAVSDLLACWKNRADMPKRMPTRVNKAFKAEAYVPYLDAVIRQLSTKSWFAAEGWMGRASAVSLPPTAIASMHIFKKHWFNSQGQGIHFETFIGPKEARKRHVPVTLHLLHTPAIPGTTLKRTELSKLVVDACFDTVSSWKGYRFKVGKYGIQPFMLQLAYNDDAELSAALTTEFARMCRTLGPAIDRALIDLLGKAT